MRQHSKLSRFLSLALCICMLLAMIPAVSQPAEAANDTTTIYFQNNWLWSDVKIYCWDSKDKALSSPWPGTTMTKVGNDGLYDIYKYVVPANAAGIIVNGKKNDGTGRDQTPDIKGGWYDGIAYSMLWNDGNKVTSKHVCNLMGGHNFKNNTCSFCGTAGRTIYFQNTWEWQDVKVHYWKSGGVETTWPGAAVDYFGEATVDGIKRYYSKLVVPADATGFIINGTNNSNTGKNKVDQTVTLTLDGWYDGITYYIDQEGFTTADDGHHECKVKNFPICDDFAAEHKYDANNTCTRCDKTKCQIKGHAFKNDVCTVCEIQGQTIYFQNNKFWDDVRVYYWTGKDDSKVDNGWPGVYMEHVGDAMGSEAVVSHYKLTIPANVDGFIISGAGETRPQTQNLTLEGLEYPDAFFIDTDGEASTFKLCLALTGMHDWQTLDAEEATCTQEGKAEGQKCAYCETVNQETTPVKPHNQDGDICADCGAELMDIYFENSWKWENVKIYYWFEDKRPVPAYPGVAMEVYGTNNGNNYFGFKIPKDVAGFVFSGTGTGNSAGQKEETVNIESGWYNGATYYPDKRVNGKETDKCTVGNFPICVDFPRNHKFNDNKCAFCGNPEYIWIFLKDVWGWSNVEIHYQGSRIANNDLAEVSIPMTLWEEGSNIYYAVIPADPDFICFTGSDFTGSDDFASKLIESGWTHGTLYELDDSGGNTRDTITSVYPCALGHDYVVEVIVPTCISGGYTSYTCSRCDDYYEDSKVAEDPDNHADPDTVYIRDNEDGTHSEMWNCCHTPTGAAEDHINNDKDGRCDICNALMAPVQLMYTTAGLDGKISVNYFFLLSEEVASNENAYVQFKVGNNEPVIVPVSEAKYVESTGYYQFTYEVAAKEMTNSIYIQFYVGEDATWTEDIEYNVRKYAENILKQYDDKNTIELMKAMVTYGAAAQAHFGYATDDLANSILAEEDQIDLSKVFIENYTVLRGQGTSKVKFYSASLILESETTLRLFFSGRPASVTHNGNELTINQRAGLYYVDIPGISAKDLDEDVTVVLSDGETTTSIVYNPMSYCQSIQNAVDGMYPETMKDLVRALYLYNQAANAYFGE